MLTGIIAAGFLARLTGEKPEVLIAVAGTAATIFSINRNFRKIELELIYNGRKMPEWVVLLTAAIRGIILIIPISFILGLMFRTPIGFQLIVVAPLVALLENRKISRQKILVIFTEIIFQFVLIIQFAAIIFIIKGMTAIAISVMPLSFFLCFWAYRIERKIEKKIEEQINARQDE